jgi:hypothetical protein
MNSTSSDNSGSLDTRIAVAAIIVAAAALFVAFFQLLVQCFTSPTRQKCLNESIGLWSRKTSHRWEFPLFYLRVSYPTIDLDILNSISRRDKVMEDAPPFLRHLVSELGSRHCQRSCSEFDQDPNANPWSFLKKFYYRIVMALDASEHKYTVGCICETVWYLVKNFRRISWYHRGGMVRASWANMLNCIGVPFHNDLILGAERADIIPSPVDTPLQSTTLFNLGLWCFVLGLNNMTVNDTDGTITAWNDVARMATTDLSNVPGIGQVVGLHGNLDALKETVLKASVAALKEVARIAKGAFGFPSFQVDPRCFRPKHIVCALQNRWDSKTWRDHQYSHFLTTFDGSSGRGGLATEAEQWQQEKKEFRCTSLLKSLAFLPYHSIWSGFPLNAFLSPYEPYVKSQRKTWWEGGGQYICGPDASLSESIKKLDIPFVEPESKFLLVPLRAAGSQSRGYRSWLFHSHRELLEHWDKTIYSHISNIDIPFPVVDTVLSLLRGQFTIAELLVQREQEKLWARTASVQACLWLTLYMLDERIQVVWCRIEPSSDLNNCREWLTAETVRQRNDRSEASTEQTQHAAQDNFVSASHPDEAQPLYNMACAEHYSVGITQS